MELNSSIDLYEAAIMAKPMTGEIIKKHNYVSGVYKLMVPVSDLPKLEWYQIFNMIGVEVPLKTREPHVRGSLCMFVLAAWASARELRLQPPDVGIVCGFLNRCI